jgi:hypothetical protein
MHYYSHISVNAARQVWTALACNESADGRYERSS